jgi:hypothetical protein
MASNDCQECKGTGNIISRDGRQWDRHDCGFCRGIGTTESTCDVCGAIDIQHCPECDQELCKDCLPDPNAPCVYCEDERPEPDPCGRCGGTGEVAGKSFGGSNGAVTTCPNC